MKVIVEADGGSRGNPGVAGSGSVVYDAATKEVLGTVVQYVGKASNNIAEYQALINGLRAARELAATEVYVFMDSKLVVEQMSGRWKIKHPDMQRLAIQARELAAGFDRVAYTWVPRAKNKKADELSNIGMDAAAGGAQPHYVADHTTFGCFFDGAATDRKEPAPRRQEPAPSRQEPAPSRKDPAPAAGDLGDSGATLTPTRLILLRHGQTDMTRQGLYSGTSDPDLNQRGKQQAAAAAAEIAARWPQLAAIVTSPSRRAQQTAAPLAEKLDCTPHILDELREMDFGHWDGLTFSQAHERDPEWHSQWLGSATVAPPGGESLAEAYKRTKKAHRKILTHWPGATVAVVSHVTPITALLRLGLKAGPSVFHTLHLDTASISVVDFYADGPSVVSLINGTSHL